MAEAKATLPQAGGCLCGALRYEVAEPPVRVTICHCRFCQRATGTAYFVEPIFRREDFRAVAGEARTYDHRSEGSGKVLTLHFCETCGTKLYIAFERFPDIIGVYGGTFDDPDWFERSGDNARHIFRGVAQRGTVMPAGVATYEAHAVTEDGSPAEPQFFDAHFLIQ